eukprot:comp23867_c0_seq1/m.41813 comp23867_c0_seq1/g.41813  ORF comp23867_c0_seq1/g.41813 comp23867_c0_seq1/m.41813 type:complete len:149 (-) comp23867_c0_seq1:205-651(-)
MAASAQDFVGRFALDRNNSGDLGAAHLTLAGVNFIKRKMLLALAVDMEFELDGDKLTEKTLTTFVNKSVTFTLGGAATEYFDDGIGYDLVKSIRFEDGKLVSDIKEKKGQFTIDEVRYLSADKKVLHFDTVMHYKGKDAVSKRQFVRC